MIRQVMEGAGLTLWPILSLLIFTLSSAAMIVWMFRPGAKGFYLRLSEMALDNPQVTSDEGDTQVTQARDNGIVPGRRETGKRS